MMKSVRRLLVISCMLVAASVCLTSEPARVPVDSVAEANQVTYQVVHGFEIHHEIRPH